VPGCAEPGASSLHNVTKLTQTSTEPLVAMCDHGRFRHGDPCRHRASMGWCPTEASERCPLGSVSNISGQPDPLIPISLIPGSGAHASDRGARRSTHPLIVSPTSSPQGVPPPTSGVGPSRSFPNQVEGKSERSRSGRSERCTCCNRESQPALRRRVARCKPNGEAWQAILTVRRGNQRRHLRPRRDRRARPPSRRRPPLRHIAGPGRLGRTWPGATRCGETTA